MEVQELTRIALLQRERTCRGILVVDRDLRARLGGAGSPLSRDRHQ